MKINKTMQKLVDNKKIEIEEETFKVYLDYYQKFSSIFEQLNKNKRKNSKDEEKEKLLSILKLSFVILILFANHPNDYAEIIDDLYQVASFDDQWAKVYIDILISLFHMGNNALSDYCLNTFKKISKHLDKSSIDVLFEFLNSEEKVKGEENEEIEEENEEENGNMFDGLVEDIEMES